MAIVLSGSPVRAETQPLPHTPLSFEFSAPLHFTPSHQTSTPANFNVAPNEAVLDPAQDHAPTAMPLAKEPVLPALEQSAIPLAGSPLELSDQLYVDAINAFPRESKIEPKNESTNEFIDELAGPASLLDPIAQSDTPAPQPAKPAAEPASGNRWQFSVEPYFFVPLNVQADVTTAGRSASLDFGLDDVLELDRAFDAGLRLEAWHHRLGFILDGFYVSAAQSGNVGVTFPAESLQRFGIPTAARVEADASIAVREVTVDAAVAYRVVDTVLGQSAESPKPYPRLVVAPILGLRTRVLWQEIEVETVRLGNLSLPLDREFNTSRTTVEPLVGGQIGLDLSERWAINARGDVSGFNLNAEEDFTWNFLIGTQYRLSPTISLQLAYRFNGFDFEDGEGLRRTRLNLYQNGLWLSGIFRF